MQIVNSLMEIKLAIRIMKYFACAYTVTRH